MVKHTLKPCGRNNTIFLKYVWPFFNIVNEKVKLAYCGYLFGHGRYIRG